MYCINKYRKLIDYKLKTTAASDAGFDVVKSSNEQSDLYISLNYSTWEECRAFISNPIFCTERWETFIA